jgi:hypothetical protein
MSYAWRVQTGDAMPGSKKMMAAALGTMLVLSASLGCRERSAVRDPRPVLDAAGLVADPCAGDSLRPAAGAPAQGVWLNEQARGARVAVMIGPPTADEQALVVTRPVESMEVTPESDTIRHRLDAAKVSLELLPPPGSLGADSLPIDSTVRSPPAATYAVSANVRLAAYEPCVTSNRGPRVRYLRRDAAGQIVTDVMLYRASEQ